MVRGEKTDSFKLLKETSNNDFLRMKWKRKKEQEGRTWLATEQPKLEPSVTPHR